MKSRRFTITVNVVFDRNVDEATVIAAIHDAMRAMPIPGRTIVYATPDGQEPFRPMLWPEEFDARQHATLATRKG